MIDSLPVAVVMLPLVALIFVLRTAAMQWCPNPIIATMIHDGHGQQEQHIASVESLGGG